VEGAERQARQGAEHRPESGGRSSQVLGHLLWVQFRDGSSAELRRAIELNPNDADAQYYYGEYLSLQSGETENMYKHLNRARDLDPMSPLYIETIASHHAQRGEMRALRELGADHHGPLSRCGRSICAFTHSRYGRSAR
jgi:tetratricopeptide (TPR) repeat protein